MILGEGSPGLGGYIARDISGNQQVGDSFCIRGCGTGGFLWEGTPESKIYLGYDLYDVCNGRQVGYSSGATLNVQLRVIKR